MAPRESAQFNIEVRNLGPLSKKLQTKMPQVYDRALFSGIQAATLHVKASIQDLLEGKVLNRRTGFLWRSFTAETFRRGGTVVGIVGTATKYAPVHEFGAIIRPKKAGGVLVFQLNGTTVFARQVRIPRRPFVSRAFREQRGKVVRIIKKQVNSEAKRHFEGGGQRGVVLPTSARAGVTNSIIPR